MTTDKIEYMVTLDEAIMYLVPESSKTDYYYFKRGEELPDNCIIASKETSPKSVMVVGGMSGRGTLPLIPIPKDVKISAANYIAYALKPYFEVYLPQLYPVEMHCLVFHHDKASSHTAKLTMEYLEDLRAKYGITFLEKSDIPVKGLI